MSNLKRVGMVIGVKAEAIDQYKAIHADREPGVRDLLSRYHMKNFSIFLHKLPDGNHYLFGYFEYDGTDYEADMAKLAAEPRDQAWHAITDNMQVPLPGEKLWATMEEVYFNK